MKIEWLNKDHKAIVLIAETKAEAALGDIVVEGMNAFKWGDSKTSARWTIIPLDK